MNDEEKVNDKSDIYSKIESSLKENIQNIIASYDSKKKIKQSLDAMEINEKKIEEFPIKTVEEFRKRISSSENGTILRVDEKVLKDSIKSYRESILAENIVGEIYEKYEDPFVAFYTLYKKSNDFDKNIEFETLLSIFNLYYQTDYISLEDFLKKNNFGSFEDLKKYVHDNLHVGRRT